MKKLKLQQQLGEILAELEQLKKRIQRETRSRKTHGNAFFYCPAGTVFKTVLFCRSNCMRNRPCGNAAF